MRNSYKILLCISLFVIALTVVATKDYPAFSEMQVKAKDVDNCNKENATLTKKLDDRQRAQDEKQTLEGQIQSLRGSVPRSPELDLLVLDLERLCQSCDLDLVGVENLGSDALLQIKNADEQKAKESAGLLAIGAKSLPKLAPSPAVKVETIDQTSLRNLPKQVFVTGSYDNFIRLMRKLENYQRVIGINNVSVALPSADNELKAQAADKANRLKVTQPMMSFVMTIYYLP
jgi:Tfp pilus assembly protein PilO